MITATPPAYCQVMEIEEKQLSREARAPIAIK